MKYFSPFLLGAVLFASSDDNRLFFNQRLVDESSNVEEDTRNFSSISQQVYFTFYTSELQRSLRNEMFYFYCLLNDKIDLVADKLGILADRLSCQNNLNYFLFLKHRRISRLVDFQFRLSGLVFILFDFDNHGKERI